LRSRRSRLVKAFVASATCRARIEPNRQRSARPVSSQMILMTSVCS